MRISDWSSDVRSSDLPADELADHVRSIIADAGLDLGEDAVEHVVRQGGGSARDTLSALDQVAAMGGVVHEGRPVEAILEALCEADPGAALVAVAEATAAGRDPRPEGRRVGKAGVSTWRSRGGPSP